MRQSTLLATLVACAVTLLATALPAHAQATRTWVSGVGDDANPCSRTAPCKTFAGAISKTAVNGIINCLDPAGYGAVTITKSIEIDCHHVIGSVLVSGTNGINISGAGINVTLRGLSVEGIGTGLIGVNILQANAVHIEQCRIWGFQAGSARGVSITSGAIKVFISDTTFAENGTGATGGSIISAPSAASSLTVDRVSVTNSVFGLASNFNSKVSIGRSVFNGNTTGVEADPGAQVFLGNSDVSFNATAFMGTVTSFGNNRAVGNTSIGTTPTLGAASTDHGQL